MLNGSRTSASLADAGAPAVLAPAPDAVMPAYAGAPAVHAPVPLADMLADAGSIAVLALLMRRLLAPAPEVLALAPGGAVRRRLGGLAGG
jgi:hypothetical protein